MDVTSGGQQSLGRFNANDMPNVARQAVSALEENWKSARLTRTAQAITRPLTVLYSSHQEWLNIRNIMNNASNIETARLDALARDGALMTLTYSGELSGLARELSFKGLTLEQDPTTGLILSSR